MAISRVLTARASDVITSAATLSFLSGAAAAAFPLNNAKDGKAHTVFKSTGTSCTIRSHWAAPVTLEGLVLPYHKLAGCTVTVTNPAGFSQVITIPANTADGHCIDPWKDFRGLSNVTDDDWDIAISGAATVVALGEIVWVQAWRELLLDWGPAHDFDQPSIVLGTDYHPQAHVYRMGTRVRRFRATTLDAVTTAEVQLLQLGAKGPLTLLPWILDSNVNDALYARFVGTHHGEAEPGPRTSGMRSTGFEIIEALRGLAL